MKIATAKLSGVGSYSQSKAHDTPKEPREGADAYEQRTWREKAHSDSSGQVYIPAMAFKMALDSCAKFLGKQIPGKGKSTYTKHFLAGVLVLENVPLGIHRDDLAPIRIYANADGVRGSGKRVWRTIPTIPQWEAEVSFHILDDTITKEVFEEHLTEAGKFIGIGQFRPQNGGFNGRWDVKSVTWS